MITLSMTGMFFIGILLGMPVGMAMLVVALAAMALVLQVPMALIPQLLVTSLSKFELLAVPLFILAAEIMNAGGLTKRIFNLALLFVGRIAGGLAQVNIFASMIFAGISGAAVADAAGLGRVEYRAMTEAGYKREFSAAVTLASCLIGPLIPPSIVMVIYAVEAQVSVGRMLLAGVVPGILMALLLMAYVYFVARTGRTPCPTVRVPGGKEALKVLASGLPSAVAPFIIVGGLVGGVLTVTETGVAACVYTLLVATAVHREMTWRSFALVLERTVLSSAMVMFMIAAASAMSWVITWEQSVQDLAHWFGEFPVSIVVKMLMLVVFLLIIGLVIEGVPAMLVVTPVFLPIVMELGMDPVQFGVVMASAMGIGLLTPPMGLALFVVSGYTQLSVERLAKAVLPFLIPLTAVLLLVTFASPMSTWLPYKLLP